MKPTPEEKQWLQEYLYQALSYRETYAEVYDHILLALEDRPAHEFFASTVNDIIEEDFGGSINMLNMEVDCKYTTDNEVKAEYWNIVLGWFKYPLVIYTALTWVVALFIITRHSLITVAVMAAVVILVGVLLPVILISIRSFRMGKVYGDTKESIRDSAFRWLIYGFFVVNIFILGPTIRLINFIMMHTLSYQTKLDYEKSYTSFFIQSIGLMIVIIHFLSLVKLYKNEFKTGIVKA